jgi:hypothetical protein
VKKVNRDMALNPGGGSGILNPEQFDIEVLGSPPGTFHSSLRDFSSLESLPRTASWAKFNKFNRPCGTHLAIGRFSRRLFRPGLWLCLHGLGQIRLPAHKESQRLAVPQLTTNIT